MFILQTNMADVLNSDTHLFVDDDNDDNDEFDVKHVICLLDDHRIRASLLFSQNLAPFIGYWFHYLNMLSLPALQLGSTSSWLVG